MTRKEEIIETARQKEKEIGFSQIVREAKGVNSAYGAGFLEGAEWADEHPKDDLLEGILIHGNNDAYRIGYKKAIEKACEWLEANGNNTKEFIEKFKKAQGKWSNY